MIQLKQAIEKHGAPLLGVAVYSYNPIFVELAGYLGFHVLWIEMEHMPNSFDEACNLCRIASGVGLLTMIRISDSRRENVLKAVECGPDIIDLPMGNSPEALEDLVRHARYAPEGDRGFFCASRAFRYGVVDAVAEQQRRINSRLCVMAQVETCQAVDHVEELCSVPGVDAVFIGSGDLSCSLGVPGETEHPYVLNAVERTISVAKRYGKLVACPGGSEQAVKWASMGADILFCGSDVSCMRAGAESILQGIKELHLRRPVVTI